MKEAERYYRNCPVCGDCFDSKGNTFGCDSIAKCGLIEIDNPENETCEICGRHILSEVAIEDSSLTNVLKNKDLNVTFSVPKYSLNYEDGTKVTITVPPNFRTKDPLGKFLPCLVITPTIA